MFSLRPGSALSMKKADNTIKKMVAGRTSLKKKRKKSSGSGVGPKRGGVSGRYQMIVMPA
jgi:hypothetical protein